MKLTVILLTVGLFQVHANGSAQSVTIKGKNIPVQKVFSFIESQTGYSVFGNLALLEKAHPVTVDVVDMDLHEFLKIVTKGQPFSYLVAEKTIILSENRRAENSSIPVNSPSFSPPPVIGIVSDSVGVPLVGATVSIKNSKKSTFTDDNGRFSLMANEGDILVFSFVGYRNKELKLTSALLERSEINDGGNSVIRVVLAASVSTMNEVNVTYSTGYQNIPKERATGSFVQIDNKLLNRTVSTNLLDRLLQVTSSLKLETANLKSNGSNISIRGFSTINANMKPLIVIDGFVYEEEKIGMIRPEEILLNNLNPNDVESVTILRDAAAASIWGARSGNGVIVINTKKGRYNQPVNISFSNTVNITEKPRLNKMKVVQSMDIIELEKKQFSTGAFDAYDDAFPSYDYFPETSPVIELLLKARKENLGNPDYNAINDPAVLAQLEAISNHDVRNDVSKYLLQTGINQQYSLNLSGGTDKIRYYGSVGFDNNQSIERGNKNNRLTLRFDNSYRPIKKLELNTYLVYTKSKNVSNGVGYMGYLPTSNIKAKIYQPLADEQGNPLPVSPYRNAYLDTAQYPGLLDWHYRPVDEINNNDNTSNVYSTRFGGKINYSIIPGLNIEVSSQYEKELSNRNDYKSLKNYATRDLINRYMSIEPNGIINYPVPLGGILDFTDAERTTWNVRAHLALNKTWNVHQVTAIAGVEASEAEYNFRSGRTYGYNPDMGTGIVQMDYKNNYPTRANSGSSQTIPANQSFGGTLNQFTSYFANAAYVFNNKYTISGSGRVDGSNFLGAKANQRFNPLWSSGVSWDISKENFYKVRWAPNLKLRITYGYNANLNNKATALPTATYFSPDIQYHTGYYLYLNTPANPGLTWERVRNVNFGLDYSLLNSRISGSIEYYAKEGIDLIGSMMVEATSGVASYSGNYANMKSNGFDIRLNTINIDRRLQWQTNINVSYNADKITHYEIDDFQQNYTGNYLYTSFTVLNRPLLKIYSYRDAELDPSNGNPRGYVNGKVEDFSVVLENAKPEDLVYNGSATPQLFGNMLNTFSYKQLSLSFNIGFRLKYFVRKVSLDYFDLFNRGYAHPDYYLRWQQPGDELTTNVPSMPKNVDSRGSYYQSSSSLVLKGDHIRLVDTRVSYSLNKSLMASLPFSDITVSLYASNLGILWKANKEGIDPEAPDSTLPPVSRNIAIGLNLNF